MVDRQAAAVSAVTDLYDVSGVVGNGASYRVQQEAGIDEADILISVTASDELNLLCCTVAKKAGNCATIARVRTPDYSEDADYLKEKLGLAMVINPEREAALAIARLLCLPTALSVTSFAGGHAEMVRIRAFPRAASWTDGTCASWARNWPDRCWSARWSAAARYTFRTAGSSWPAATR